jgi:hypothetical protein
MTTDDPDWRSLSVTCGRMLGFAAARAGEPRAVHARHDQVLPHPFAKGWHSERASPWLFVDGCTQIREDADVSALHRHTPTAHVVTAFRPQSVFEDAVDAMMGWWRVARTCDTVRLALTAQVILDAKAQGQAAIIIGTQGGDVIGRNLSRLEVMHRLGLRVLSYTQHALRRRAGAGGRRAVEARAAVGLRDEPPRHGDRPDAY